MASTSNVFNASPFRSSGWRELGSLLRDVLGGALVLAVLIALWVTTWAAVAGPLREDARARGAPIAAVERA
jgi:hypothetical protein